MAINSLFQAAEPPKLAQSHHDELDVPAEVRMNLVQLLDWYTPNIFVSWIILGFNIVVFAVMCLSGVNPEHPAIKGLLHWGANYGPLSITQREWWRLVTCTFLHSGFTHIAFNMFALAQIGPFLERLLGNFAFLAVYLICGIAGSLVSSAWSPYIVSVGASGAIFGLYGALIGFLILRHDSVPKAALQKVLKGALIFVGYNVVFGFVNAGTDVAAHFGGLFAGLVCGLAVSTPITTGFTRRRLIRAALLTFAAVPVLFGLVTLSPHPADFIKEMNDLVALDTRTHANLSFMLTQARTGHLKDADLASQIQKEMIVPWRAERFRLATFTRLPPPQTRARSLLLEYMTSTEQAWANLVQGLQTHNRKAIMQSFVAQTQASQKLTQSMATLQ